MRLSAGQLDALRNLSAKQNGDLVGWISIGAALRLTNLGFAARTQSGWRITPAGAAALDMARPPCRADATVVPLQRPNRAGPLAP